MPPDQVLRKIVLAREHCFGNIPHLLAPSLLAAKKCHVAELEWYWMQTGSKWLGYIFTMVSLRAVLFDLDMPFSVLASFCSAWVARLSRKSQHSIDQNDACLSLINTPSIRSGLGGTGCEGIISTVVLQINRLLGLARHCFSPV